MKNKKEKISELKRTDLNSIKISLSYPMQISACSSGLVKNSETLNYKTLDPENNGLFCSKIFGVSKDYICSCGETKGSKFINIICKICGVETGPSKLRRSRMGHIVFNSFVLNTLFFKATPSYLSIILNISVNNIENILYNDYYLVIYPGEIGLKLNQVLSLNEYLYFSKKYIDKFYADTGIEAIKIALDHIDINYEINLLKKFFILKKNYLSLKYKKNLRRYNIFIYLKKFNITPSRLILENLPILPPDLRPIVKLPSGSLVSSDLNELYKRVINRNNRLKNLISIKAPSVVLFNEKKLLQESIDSLFDNSERVNNISCGSNKQPLKSLSDNIKGKFGLFRQNLLGKRVDYSGRSVIVSGPNLKLNECILPKIIALELFRPFIYNKLISENFNFNIKNAKLEVDKGSDLAIDALLTILKNHPVLLNRAPTLHRLGMQAFNVILSDDKAIKLHPLVCVAFNADFDGDQMAVHIPLSIKAQLEFKQLLISTNNVLHPANGTCCISPTQDIVLGIYYSTRLDINKIGNGMIFNNLYEIRIAYELNLICLNTRIFLRLKNFSTLDTDNFDKKSNFSYTVYETTPGRAFIFNILPKNISYSCINKVFKKNDISNLLIFIYENFGSKSLINFSDNLMSLGFDFATKSGISISIDDMIIHPDKNIIINKSKDLVKMYNLDYYNGLLSQTNRRKKILDIWELASEMISGITIESLYFETTKDINGKKNKIESFNSFYLMISSGARGSEAQIKQICGMRGLMSYKNHGLMEIPVINSLREGLSALEYFYFSHGSRKTLADTALKTSNAGYLTRRLVEVANDIFISEEDCNTNVGLIFKSLINKGVVIESFLERIVGRVLSEDIINYNNNSILYKKNTLITKNDIKFIENLGINIIKIRSPITCQSSRGVCSLCYGFDLSKNKLVNIGELVGIIAAQSIGEPGTQLTMRTFHSGGGVNKNIVFSSLESNNNGIIEYSSSLKYVINNGIKIVVSKIGKIKIKNFMNEELETVNIPYASSLLVNNNCLINIGDIICKWDPYYNLIVSEINGYVKFENFVENLNFIKRLDNKTGIFSFEILQLDKNFLINIPSLRIYYNDKNFFEYKLFSGSFVVVADGVFVNSGDILVKTAISLDNIGDITGGLPKVVELFEARIPKESAILASIDGLISFRITKKGVKYLIINGLIGDIIEYRLPLGRQLLVSEGQLVNKGDMLLNGVLNPHDILNIYGIDDLTNFLLSEIKGIYHLQGVKINDKHIEIIIKQMLNKVLIICSGSSSFVMGELISKNKLISVNKKILLKSGNLIKYKNVLSGITNSALSSDSFLSSASFQQTTSILTQSSIISRTDKINSLKENVMLGRVIPMGVGYYSKIFKKR